NALRAFLGNPAPFITVAIGFLVIGSYWLSHRATFALLRATDGSVVGANLVFLFWIAMQPFFTEALADHPPNTTSVVAYASCQVLTGIAQLLIWVAALHHQTLLSPAASPRRRR